MGRTRKAAADAGLVTRKELAVALGCDIRTVDRWQNEGLPVAKHGRGGRPSLYDLPACEAWRAERDQKEAGTTTPKFARERKDLAQALEAEQRVGIKAKELVYAKDVEQLIADEYARCRTKLLGLARKAKALLPHLSAKDVRALDVLVREALEDLSNN